MGVEGSKPDHSLLPDSGGTSAEPFPFRSKLPHNNILPRYTFWWQHLFGFPEYVCDYLGTTKCQPIKLLKKLMFGQYALKDLFSSIYCKWHLYKAKFQIILIPILTFWFFVDLN